MPKPTELEKWATVAQSLADAGCDKITIDLVLRDARELRAYAQGAYAINGIPVPWQMRKRESDFTKSVRHARAALSGPFRAVRQGWLKLYCRWALRGIDISLR